jgi:tetrahydromethanopterin S-methyltransferase subunit A
MSVLDVLNKYDGKVDQVIYEEIKKEAEADEALSKGSSHKKSQENASLRSRLRKTEEYLTKLGLEVNDEIETQIEEYLSKSKTVTTSLEQKVNMLVKKLEDKEKAESELTKKLNNKTIADELRKVLRAGNTPVIEDIEDLVVESFLNSGRGKILDDKVIFDDATDVETEINTYRQKYPGRFRVKQNGGAGSNDTGSNKNVNKISEQEFNAMSAADRGRYAKEHPDFQII